MHSRDAGGNAAEGASSRAAWLRIPGFELAWSATKPKKNAAFLSLLRFRGEDRVFKQPGEAGDARSGRGQAFEEQASMNRMLIGATLAGG